MTMTAVTAATSDAAIKFTPAPATVAASHMAQFARRMGLADTDYASLWRWSVENKEKFWDALWDDAGIIGDKGATVFRAGETFRAARFFPDGKLNFAENLLRRRDDGVAIVFRGEDKVERILRFADLYAAVSRMQQVLISLGVGAGDRVAGYLPNMPESIIAMLAATSLGAVWSSASPDFGVQGVIDRFGQIEPKVFFAVDGYYYNGKEIDCRDKIKEIVTHIPSIERTIVVEYLKSGAYGYDTFDGVIADIAPREMSFERFDFNHPLYIMFSSGTTGVPKCIVHGAGGTLLQHVKELRLHSDIGRDDRVFYFTTCAWMMWNWLVSSLACGAGVLLYDGSPFYPDQQSLFRYARDHGCTFFGTSAKYIDALRQAGIKPARVDSIRMVASTGSPLVHESFDYAYDHLFPDVPLASISGGTDIVSCFVLGNPLSVVRRGEIQGAGLGMDVDVFDDAGRPLASGAGELVCKTPFPAMPVGFWNDPAGEKFNNAYFTRFDNVWCHGDWCEWTAQGGFIIHGRSDATLNPGGVRIGTAEIYRIVEQIDGVRECIAVGQQFDGDVRVVLFVVMQDGKTLEDGLIARIKNDIRAKATPRHVPAKVIAVPDIPRTKNGKMTELAVRDVIHGRNIRNVEVLANPDALKHYEDLKELQQP